MSDALPAGIFSPPPDLQKRLDDLAGQIAGIEKVLQGLEALGQDTTAIRNVFNALQASRNLLIQAYSTPPV